MTTILKNVSFKNVSVCVIKVKELLKGIFSMHEKGLEERKADRKTY